MVCFSNHLIEAPLDDGKADTMLSKYVGEPDEEVLPVILRRTETEYSHIETAKPVSAWLKRVLLAGLQKRRHVQRKIDDAVLGFQVVRMEHVGRVQLLGVLGHELPKGGQRVVFAGLYLNG